MLFPTRCIFVDRIHIRADIPSGFAETDAQTVGGAPAAFDPAMDHKLDVGVTVMADLC